MTIYIFLFYLSYRITKSLCYYLYKNFCIIYQYVGNFVLPIYDNFMIKVHNRILAVLPLKNVPIKIHKNSTKIDANLSKIYRTRKLNEFLTKHMKNRPNFSLGKFCVCIVCIHRSFKQELNIFSFERYRMKLLMKFEEMILYFIYMLSGI